MAECKGRRTGRGAPALAIPAAAILAASGRPVGAADLSWHNLLSSARLDPYNAVSFALLMGLLIFAITTALLHLRERGRWAQREGALRAELAALAGADDRAALLLGSEAQILVTWTDRTEEPRVEGDSGVVEAKSPRRVLAFGTWLPGAEAATLEGAVERLRSRGEGFRTILHTSGRRFVEAEGRTVGGSALLRLRDVTGERLERLRLEEDLARDRTEIAGLRGLLDAVPQPVWLRDRAGAVAWANRAYLAAIEAESLGAARARGLELLDRAARDEAALRRREGRAYAARLPAVVAGTRRVLEVTEVPAGDGGSAGMAVDVSELEAVRADLQRQTDAHVRTLDQLPTAVAIFDDKQRLVFHNAAYRQLWKLDQAFLEQRPLDGEVLDRLRAARLLPEQADFRSWKAQHLAAYRAVESQETWWHLPDRRTIRVVANPRPQGGLTYLFDDVSERMDLASRYNALLRVQGETLNTLKEGVAVFGTDGRLKLANRAFADLWGLSADDEKPPHVDEAVRVCRAAAPDAAWDEIRAIVVGSRDMRHGFSCTIERRDGTVLDCTAQPLPDGATLLTFVDITASTNVERALTEKNEALERAAQLRDDFVHHVSYELRSPLTTIIGFTQLLGDETVGALNPRQREYAGHIMRSSAALLAIINDILDLASIDTGSMELAREPVDIRESIEAAARGVADRLAESSVALAIDVPADIGSFLADRKRVNQILFNLLSNAVGFSYPGQTVRVAARRRDGEVELRVSDEGRGIPPEVVEKVFERFESHTLGTRHRGVGLGLAIVRSFVELHGGRVELASAPGTGTTVTCTFPAAGAPQRAAA